MHAAARADADFHGCPALDRSGLTPDDAAERGDPRRRRGEAGAPIGHARKWNAGCIEKPSSKQRLRAEAREQAYLHFGRAHGRLRLRRLRLRRGGPEGRGVVTVGAVESRGSCAPTTPPIPGVDCGADDGVPTTSFCPEAVVPEIPQGDGIQHDADEQQQNECACGRRSPAPGNGGLCGWRVGRELQCGLGSR